MNLAQHLHSAGRDYPNRPALGFGTRVLFDYAALAQRVARLACALRDDLRLDPGDRVAIVSSNAPEYLEALYAIWHAGCIGVPVNAKLHPAELAYILDHSGARICFASSDLAPAIEAHAPDARTPDRVRQRTPMTGCFRPRVAEVTPREGDDLAWLFYTSGTTGRPKGAMLTHRNLSVMGDAYRNEVDRVGYGDPLLHGAPMSHGSGLYMIPYVMHCGVNVVPESGGFDAQEIFELIDAWPRASMFAAPTMVKRLVEHDGDCNAENIRTIVWGGAPMYVEDAIRALDRFGPRFAQIYGQGESPMTITVLSRNDIADRTHPRWRERLASAGRAFSCVEVVIANETGLAFPHDTPGEILVRGETVMAGYWRNEEASAAALAGRLSAYRRCRRLRRRRLSVSERPFQGPDHFRRLQHLSARGRGGAAAPSRRARGVGDRPAGPRMGRGGGGLCGGGGRTATELDTLCLNAIARFKRPKDYVFVDALPKNNYGKVLKTTLREWDAAAER